MCVCVFLTAACDDECSGVLLDDLDQIHNHFLSVNLSAVAMAPYRQLVLLENRSRDLEVNRPRPLVERRRHSLYLQLLF